ncbi:MAG: ComF family protein [Candidatus Tritonobacter lacicola]|nr:ComF family protein [Candidatus Tritonobacter lacicola]
MGILRALYLAVINLVYPANCPVCGAGLSPFEDSPLCPDCLRETCFIRGRACAGCGLPLPEALPAGDGFLCGECRMTRRYFFRAISAFVYEGPVKELIHVFKYSGRAYLAGFFAAAIADAMKGRVEVSGEEVVVPVPIHRARLRGRGYNQAGEIARRLAGLLGLKVELKVLRRLTQPAFQVGLTRSQRRENIKGCFRVADRRTVKNRRFFLVDDVYTTGSTLDECSRVLLRAGAESVIAITAARDILG